MQRLFQILYFVIQRHKEEEKKRSEFICDGCKLINIISFSQKKTKKKKKKKKLIQLLIVQSKQKLAFIILEKRKKEGTRLTFQFLKCKIG